MLVLVMRFVLDALQSRRAAKLDASLGPLSVLGEDIVGNKSNLSRSPDEFVFSGARFRSNKRKYSRAVWRSYGNPTLTGLKPGIVDQIEPELIEIECQASILITNEDFDGVKPKVRLPTIAMIV